MYAKKLDTDVALWDGQGFMVESSRYKAHLKAREADRQEVRLFSVCVSAILTNCRNHIAQTTRLSTWQPWKERESWSSLV